MSSPPPLPPTRSTFVTTLAWIFVALAGLATLISLLQNLMLQTTFQPMIHQALAQQPNPTATPPALIWLMLHVSWTFRLLLVLAVVHLVAAIGLLMRKEWGRKLFIGVMGLDILYQLASIGMQWLLLRPMMHGAAAMPPPHMDNPMAAHAAAVQMAQTMRWVNDVMTMMQVFATIVALALIVLFSWIILRLRRPTIRREFDTAEAFC